MKKKWQSLTLVQRIRLLRYVMPLVLIPIVVIYQLQIAFRLEEKYGHPVHYAAEISFYSFVGPVITWLTLVWIERRLIEKDILEREVQARTQQLASLTAASPDAILRVDHGGLISSWNQGASRLFGYSAEEMIGRSLNELILEPHLLSETLASGTPLSNLELTAVTREGHKVRVDVTQAYLKPDHDNSPIRLLIMRDVTLRSERAAILEEERGRISRDLHDGVAQTLYFLALKADMTKAQITANPEQVFTGLSEIGQQARKAIRDVRRAIFGLRPLEWAEGQFLPALQKYIEAFGEEMNVSIQTHVNLRASDIPSRLEPTIFRLVQESLNNIAKHANASEVRIQMNTDTSLRAITLLVKDNGIGFAPDQKQHGLGLRQMNKRMASVGGKFSISTQPGSGTEIRADFPLTNLKGEFDG